MFASGLSAALANLTTILAPVDAQDATASRTRRTPMDEGRPSVTAQSTATLRAAHQLLDDPRILDDPLALRIIGTQAESAVRANPQHYEGRAPCGHLWRCGADMPRTSWRTRFGEACANT